MFLYLILLIEGFYIYFYHLLNSLHFYYFLKTTKKNVIIKMLKKDVIQRTIIVFFDEIKKTESEFLDATMHSIDRSDNRRNSFEQFQSTVFDNFSIMMIMAFQRGEKGFYKHFLTLLSSNEIFFNQL